MTHSYSSIFFHVVWSTKHRQPLIESKIKEPLYKQIKTIIKQNSLNCISIGGMPNHIHLLIQLKPTSVISNIVREIKSCSSKFITGTYPEIPFAWQKGYSVFSVSVSKLNIVKNYIMNQEKHHQSKSFDEEFKKLLAKHLIAN